MQIKNIFILLALLLLSVTVYAGFAQPAPVTIVIDAGGGSAQGDMISARNSVNEFEFIGCGIRAFDDGAGGATRIGFCQASLEEGGNVVCFVYNPALLDGINNIADSSFITFGWDDDGSGLTCNRVGSSTQSFYLEKGQKSK